MAEQGDGESDDGDDDDNDDGEDYGRGLRAHAMYQAPTLSFPWFSMKVYELCVFANPCCGCFSLYRQVGIHWRQTPSSSNIHGPTTI